MSSLPVVLTIGASDASGAAGIQADQLAGQWYADVTGLGDIVPKEMRAKSLKAG